MDRGFSSAFLNHRLVVKEVILLALHRQGPTAPIPADPGRFRLDDFSRWEELHYFDVTNQFIPGQKNRVVCRCRQ